MPYIESKERREKLRKGDAALNAGELNYQIFYYIKHQEKNSLNSERVYFVIKGFVDEFLKDKISYQKYNDMTGALIRCYKELDRRLNISYSILQILKNVMNSYDNEIAKYEDIKIQQNGEIE